MINRSVINTRKLILEKIVFFLLCALFVYPILPHAIQSITIIALTTLSVVTYADTIKNNLAQLSVRPFLWFSGWFLLLMFTVLYSEDANEGIKRITRGLNFLIIPFLFLYILPVIPLKKQKILSNLFVFIHVFLLLFLMYKTFEGIDRIGYMDSSGRLIKGLFDENIFKQMAIVFQMPFYLSRYYIDENNITTFFIHKVYLSIGLVFSVFLMGNKIIKENISLLHKLLWGVLIVFFIIAIVYFTSLPNILMILVLPVFIFMNLKNKKNKALMVMLAVITIGMTFTKPLYTKIYEDKRLLTDALEAKNMLLSIIDDKPYVEGTNIRLEVWRCAFKQISKQWLFGYGIGDEEAILHNCYLERKCDDCLSLNSHNYYASLVLMGGVVVLVLFLVSLFFLCQVAIKNNNYLLAVFVLIIAVNLATENLFVRINGVLFYTIIGSFLLSNSLKKDDLI